MSNKEIDLAKELAEIESSKFEKMMEAMGPETMVEMAKAGPE